MTRGTALLGALLALASSVLAVPAVSDNAVHSRCVAATFKCLLPKGATLENVTAVPNGGSFGEGAADIPYPTNPTGLPELCAVIVRVVSSPHTSYRFGLFLPSTWNSKFLAVGNGGFAGGINWLDMTNGPHFGFATISTDLGHSSATTDLSWGLNNPEGRTDFGWRALHGSVQLGKKITQGYYKKPLKYSYYSGCSTGGRQGLKEVQISPDSFDGILVGAAAYYTSHLSNYVTKVGLYNLPVEDPKHIDWTLFPAIGEAVVSQCDKADGVADGIISSPERCTFDFSKITCGTATNASWCLTPPQIQTAKNIYSDYRSSTTGEFLYPGLNLGSEAQWWILLADTKPTDFGTGYARYFLLDDPNWDWHTYNDSLVKLAEKTDPGQSTAIDYDISAFKRRGGKVIMYHGQADGLVPTKGSDWYYNNTIATFGGLSRTQDFFRYFQIPGMQHCLGTVVDAPWAIGSASQNIVLGNGTNYWSVPGFVDERHDALLALEGWVERGRPVDKIIATTWKNSVDPASGVLRQRPLCPWPQKAVYSGRGDINAAESWSCK